MRLFFTNPPWWERDEAGRLRRGVRAGSRWPMTLPPELGYTPFPFHLAYAASYAQVHGHEVELRDSVARRESPREWLHAVQAFGPDLTILETSTPSWEADRKYLQALAFWQLGKTMVVGPPLADPKARVRALTEPGVFAVAVGEYEKAVLKAAQALERDPLRPLVLDKPDLLTEAEMNEAPPPLRNGAEHLYYADADYLTPGLGAPLQAYSSRGCPYHCTFCVWPQTMTQNSVRRYNPASLYRALAGTPLPFQAVYFDDDTFNLTGEHVRMVGEVMDELGLPWSAMCRIDTLTEADWQHMAAHGCQGIKFGVESASARSRKAMNKHLKLEKVYWYLPVLRDCGIRAHGTFILGWPGETDAEVAATRRLIEQLYLLGMASHQESGPAAHEGTKLWEAGHRASDGRKVWEAGTTDFRAAAVTGAGVKDGR